MTAYSLIHTPITKFPTIKKKKLNTILVKVSEVKKTEEVAKTKPLLAIFRVDNHQWTKNCSNWYWFWNDRVKQFLIWKLQIY